MSALLLAVVVIAVLLAVAVVVVLPRLRAGRGRRPLAGRRPAAAVEDMPETEVATRAGRPREERRLIAEGEAIREQVEAQLAAERRPAAAYPVARDPLAERDDLAWQLEQEHRERYPSTYRTAAAGHVAAQPVYGPPVVGRGAGVPVAGERDELAWQIERDRRERHPADYPVADGYGPAGPRGGGLRPATPSVSDALELQLQEIALRSRGRRPGSVGAERRRPRRFARSTRRVDVDPEDPRLAG